MISVSLEIVIRLFFVQICYFFYAHQRRFHYIVVQIEKWLNIEESNFIIK
jgi:hypothetical protein